MKKKQTFLALIAISAIIITSCSTTKSTKYATKDVDFMIKKIEQNTVLANKCSKDSKLDEKEIKKLNDLSKEIIELGEDMKTKYSNDSIGLQIVDDYMIANEAKFGLIKTEFSNAILKLYECEGSDKLSK